MRAIYYIPHQNIHLFNVHVIVSFNTDFYSKTYGRIIVILDNIVP